MNLKFRLRQAGMIAKLELRRVFLAKRSLWVYLLALFPAVVFLGHGIDVKLDQQRWAGRVTPAAVLDSIERGDSEDEVIRRAGDPVSKRRYRRGRDSRGSTFSYFDGQRRVDVRIEDGLVASKNVRAHVNFEEDRQVFAGFFHYFYLRLAIFFGCLGIFMNLFRGEMMGKTLHFWFLAPVRRDVLLAGKYMAGLAAAVTIFTTGALLSFAAMLWPQDPAAVQAYWQQQGPSHLFWYGASSALACLGYGSVFLAAGLLVRNPIIPAVVLSFWEGINGFLPAMLQKLSVLYYVESLTPVPAPIGADAPVLARMLLAPAAPVSAATAVAGLLGVTVLVLWMASRRIGRLEINYSTE
ncbi:MAG: hypothetical protein JJE04_18805 [Acidobacteriia bacterium]|nr:hypothetical protein [Terriglobia bacterium]